MRRPLSLVLVLLLVLRGLLGDAMAMGAAPVAAAPAFHASDSHHHAPVQVAELTSAVLDDGIHSGHAGHEAADKATAVHTGSCTEGGASGCGGHEHGPSCTLCGICHSSLFTPGQLEPGRVSAAATLRIPGSERFASATTLQAIKPPIS
jgi:hypothetical protein